MARGTDSGRGVLEPHRLLRPRQAVWCFCSRSAPFTLAVALTLVRTLSGEHRIRGSRSMRFAGTHGFNLAGGRRVVQKKRTRSPDRKTALAGPPDARQADGATTYGHLLAPKVWSPQPKRASGATRPQIGLLVVPSLRNDDGFARRWSLATTRRGRFENRCGAEPVQGADGLHAGCRRCN